MSKKADVAMTAPGSAREWTAWNWRAWRDWRDWRDWLPRSAPWLLLATLLAVSLVTVFAQAGRYSITVDEQLQQTYGERVLAWYTSLGHDRGFLTVLPAHDYMPEHGGVFDALIAALQLGAPSADPWLVRHLATALAGWLGVVAIALCGLELGGLELGGPWLGFAAALGLWLYPRYYGAIYNNPKDIPAAVTLTFALWATLLLVKRWRQGRRTFVFCGLLGLALGAATAIRVTAIVWFAVLAALAAGWWLFNGRAVWRERRMGKELARQGGAAAIITAAWFAATLALWPYILLNPFPNLADSIQVMSHYPWGGVTLFNGVEVPAADLPTSYIGTWLVIGSPPALLALVWLGALVARIEVARRRRLDPAVGVVALACAIPLAALQLAHPALYDTLRQFLFTIPPLVLLASYGLVQASRYLFSQRRAGPRWAGTALLAVTIISYALVVTDMAALSPYEYTYFSPLIGGLPGAAGKYETDYYGTCDKAAAAWLSANYHQYTATPAPTLDASNLLRGPMTPYLSPAFRWDATAPTFFVGFTRGGEDQRYPSYRVIHVVAAEGVPLCVVKARPEG